MRRPSTTDKVRRGAKALKRLDDADLVDIRMVVDDGIIEHLTPDERKDLDRFLEWQREMIRWLASDDTEEEPSE